MALFLLVIIIAIILGIIGAVAKGLLYLLVIGIVIFLLDLLIFGGLLRRGRSRRRIR